MSHQENQSPTVHSPSGTQSGSQVPLKKWPRFKQEVSVEKLKEETNRRFGYEPYEWQLRAALKVLEGNDGVVVAGTGKGKTMIYALLGLAVELSKTKGQYIIVSPQKTLEGSQIKRVQNANVEAAVLDEDTPKGDVSNALTPNKGAHLLFISPEYLLRNRRMKEFCADEHARTRILGVLVDDAHIIYEWAANLQRNYNELKDLRVILGNNVPWWALSATFTGPIFKTVYEALSFGKWRPFWGIDVGTERPNLFLCVRPMGPAADTFRPLIPFIPEGAQTKEDIPKTIIFFRSFPETFDAVLGIRALLPPHLHPSVLPLSGVEEETTRDKFFQDFADGHVRVLCCASPAGMGCDIPDIEVAVIYGMDSFASVVQKGGRAGRDGKTKAKAIWLVEDRFFEDEARAGGRRTDGRRPKVDPMASEYIRCQTTGKCLREFTRRALRPEPKELGLPGFNRRGTHGQEISWFVEGEGVQPEAEEVPVKSHRHNLIRKVLLPDTFAAEQILGPLPDEDDIQCSDEERAIFREVLEDWWDSYWESVRDRNPMLSRSWILGEGNLDRVVDNIDLVVNTDKEEIDRRWLRALIDTVADDSAVDSMALAVQRFHGEFFARLEE